MDSLPKCLAPLMLVIMDLVEKLEPPCRDLDALELFSGKKAITVASSEVGLKAQGYDKTYSSSEDFTTEEGFKTAMTLMLRVRPGGCLWAAPECKTWVWLSRSQTKRSREDPHGDVTKEAVLKANKMVISLALLFAVAYAREIAIFMEQPSSTVLHCLSPMREVIRVCLPYKTLTYLGSYGASSPKPILLWSSSEKVHDLSRKRPEKGTLEQLTTRDAFGTSVTGKKDQLHESQAYPTAFGKAVASLYKQLQANVGQ